MQDTIIAPRPHTRSRFLASLNVGIILLAWLYLVGVGWKNDGLWFQGDAPRHAANGIFWKDFLLSGSIRPQEYALQYYARYPVISPTQYPPIFYLLEGAIFGAFYPSPYLAKGLVLIYALIAALYLMAWMKRWIAGDAGWEASMLLLLFGFVRWANAIMLNVPATATSFAAIYHARRWTEASPGGSANRQFYLTSVLFLLAMLTYFPSGLMTGLIILALVLISRRLGLLWNWRTLCVGIVMAAILSPWLYVAIKWAPLHVGIVKNVIQTVRVASRWIFYLKGMLNLVGPFLLTVSALGITMGIAIRRWRRESLWLLLFLCAGYIALSVLGERDYRYALLLCFPIVCFISIAFHALFDWLSKSIKNGHKAYGAVAISVALAICSTQAWIAARTPIPRVQGITDVVAFMERVAPDEAVFYDGSYDGVFTFYLLSGDPGYQRRVVLGAKILYASAIMPTWSYRSYVNSVHDVVHALETRGGCRWLVIEMSKQSNRIPAARLLREAVQGPLFELVRSFPVSGPGLERIDVYRFKGDLQSVEDADLPFPILGDRIRFNARPIQR